jgi:putative nucleotidyltransferase with HDIG domain
MNDAVRQYVQKITKLPTLPIIAQEILSLVNNNLITVDKLEKIIENDPAITAKVLSVSNSAYFGIKSPTKSLGNAIMRIGFNNVKNVAIGVSLMTVMDGNGKDRALDYNRIFNHSVTVGFVARMMTKEIKCRVSEEILMDGILHDIGYLILSKYFPEEYKKVLEDYKHTGSVLESEESVFGFNHAEIGHWLAEKWKLPANVVDTISYHHKPSLVKKNHKRVALLHIADYIASKNMMSATKEAPNYPLDPEALSVLDLSKDAFDSLEANIINNLSPDEML